MSQTTPASAANERDRQEFETWARTADGNCNENDLRKWGATAYQLTEDGETYVDALVERDWTVWQAARAIPQPAAEPSPLEAPQVWSKEADMVASWERGAKSGGEPVPPTSPQRSPCYWPDCTCSLAIMSAGCGTRHWPDRAPSAGGSADARVRRLLNAATRYAFDYCQDEADPGEGPDDLICSVAQHIMAVELFAAIAAMPKEPT